jgi:hypothetical protein
VGGIASIAAIIIDATLSLMRLYNQIQEVPQALDDLQAYIGHLEKILALLQDVENDERQSHPRTNPNEAKEIINNCKQLRLRFATELTQWTQNRYILSYNWRFTYIFFFHQRRMIYLSNCTRNCLSRIGVVASIAAWYVDVLERPLCVHV